MAATSAQTKDTEPMSSSKCTEARVTTHQGHGGGPEPISVQNATEAYSQTAARLQYLREKLRVLSVDLAEAVWLALFGMVMVPLVFLLTEIVHEIRATSRLPMALSAIALAWILIGTALCDWAKYITGRTCGKAG